MTQPPEAGGYQSGDRINANENRETTWQGRYASLESQLEKIPAVAGGIVRKHWPHAEREQYLFWVGIIVMALLGAVAFFLREVDLFPNAVGLALPTIMVLGLLVIVFLHLRALQGRFGRQWSLMSGDGQLFGYLRDAGLVLGYPIELGKPDERFSMHLDIPYTETVAAVESWLKQGALPDPAPSNVPPGLYAAGLSNMQLPGSETHNVYEAEYRGAVVRALSMRVDAEDSGCDVTIGFTPRPADAETRERLMNSLIGRLQDRMIAARVLGEIREVTGAEPMPIPVMESQQLMGEPAADQAM